MEREVVEVALVAWAKEKLKGGGIQKKDEDERRNENGATAVTNPSPK